MTQNPKKRSEWKLQSLLALLIFFGVAIAAVGIYLVDGDQQPGERSLEEIHAGVNMDPEETRRTVYGNVIPIYGAAQSDPSLRVASEAESGITVGELMRRAGIFSIVLSILILLYIEFFRRDHISRLNYRSLMIVSMFALPVVVVLSTGTTVLETTKTVESCASCHVMDPFVNDLFDEESTTMAAKHVQNRWISEYACYTCHTTYGAHGTFEGKRDGFRHWLLYVTQTWDEPISFSGSYPNQNCMACHGGTQKFNEVPSHIALSDKMRADEVSCSSCHGPAHPTPAEREDVPDRHPDVFSQELTEISADDLAKLLEKFNE